MKISIFALVIARDHGGFKAGTIWDVASSLAGAEAYKDAWEKSGHHFTLDIVPCSGEWTATETEGT